MPNIMQHKRRSGVRHGGSKSIRTSGITSQSYSAAPLSLAHGVASSSSQRSVGLMKDSSEKEKKEMQGLNVKLASYLENVRYLEADNKYLRELLSKAKIEFNVEIIKVSYQDQLNDLKALLEEKDKELAATKSRNESLEEEVVDLREQLRHMQDTNDQLQITVDGLHDEVARRTADSETARRRAMELEKQLADWKARNGILEGQLNELRMELQNETTQRLSESARVEALEDELAFLSDVHQAEIKEYQAMLSKSQNIPDLRDTWKAEFGSIVADLSAEYESQLKSLTIMMESRHAQELSNIRAGARPEASSQVSTVDGRRSRSEQQDISQKLGQYESQISALKATIRSLESELDLSNEARASENAEHQAEVNGLRMELEAMMTELRTLMDAKLSLELEIAAYRKLIEGEETRMSFGGVVTSIGGYQTEGESALASAMGKASKVTMSRSTNGTVAIVELESDGRYIEIEDNAKFPKGATNLKNWTLTQTIEGGKSYTHKFTDGNAFSSGKMLKVWGAKHGSRQEGITSSSVTEWCSLNSPSTITLKDDKDKESAVLAIKISM